MMNYDDDDDDDVYLFTLLFWNILLGSIKSAFVFSCSPLSFGGFSAVQDSCTSWKTSSSRRYQTRVAGHCDRNLTKTSS